VIQALESLQQQGNYKIADHAHQLHEKYFGFDGDNFMGDNQPKLNLNGNGNGG
jgi:hypothetical protein